MERQIQRHNVRLPRPSRWVYLWNQIAPDTIESVTNQIMDCFKRSNKAEIVLFINSGGGDLDTAIAFYHKIRFCRINLITIGLGEIASAALIIYLSGKKRYILPDTTFYFHEGTVNTVKNMPKGEYKAAGKRSFHAFNVSERIVCAETQITIGHLRSLESKCFLMKEFDAVKLGIARRVISEPLPKLQTQTQTRTQTKIRRPIRRKKFKLHLVRRKRSA